LLPFFKAWVAIRRADMDRKHSHTNKRVNVVRFPNISEKGGVWLLYG
jgi:hypothetical protein